MDVRAELVRAAQEGRETLGGIATPELGSVGAQKRRERRDLHRDVGPRDDALGVALEDRPRSPATGGSGEFLERAAAAVGIAIRLRLSDRGLAQEVHGAG